MPDAITPPGPPEPQLADTRPDTSLDADADPAFVAGFREQGHPRYRFGEVLGEGSSAQVLAASDLVFDRPVAVKVLTSRAGGAVARFIREARITALLDHPNVITVYDLEFDDHGHSFLVMKRIEGTSFGEALRQREQGQQVPGVASVNAVLGIVLKVCDALSRAHARGVIHRDIKPDNILLGSDGEVTLVDWGEARVSGEDSGVRRGTVVGTPLYMSPEQARGETAGPASDIYCLGATIFHALLGRPPLRPDDVAAFMRRRATGELDMPVPLERSRIPAPLLAIVLKALRAAPEERYPSIVTLRDDLLNFQAGLAVSAFREGVLSRAWRWVRLRRVPLFALGSVLFIAIVAAWFMVGEKLKELATWGPPQVSEDFTDETWRKHWKLRTPNGFIAKEGRLVSNVPDWTTAILDEVLTAPVAIEYDACIQSDAIPCDCSLLWCSPNDDEPARPSSSTLYIQFGTNDNQCSWIMRSPDWTRLAYSPVTLEPKRTYRMRVEIEGDQIRAFLDGNEILRHREAFLFRSGRIAFYSWYSGKEFSRLRIYRKNPPEKISSLVVGDAFFRAGDMHNAEREYDHIAGANPGKYLAEEARYRQGLVAMQRNDIRAMKAAWSQISDRNLQLRTSCHCLRWLVEEDRHHEFVNEFRGLWADAPRDHDLLLQHWSLGASKCMGKSLDDMIPLCRLYVQLRTDLFPDDPATAVDHMRLLSWMDQRDGISNIRPDQTQIRRFGLQVNGRFQELLAEPGVTIAERTQALWQLGRLNEVPTHMGYFRPLFISVLLKQDRIVEARRLEDGAHVALAEGKATTVLGLPDLSPAFRCAALVQLGRLEEAASVNCAGDCYASIPQILLRREDTSDFAGPNQGIRAQARWLRRCEEQGMRSPDDYRLIESGVQYISRNLSILDGQGWFIPWFAVPFVNAMAGDRTTFGSAMQRVVNLHQAQFAQRPFFLSKLLAGAIGRDEFLAQPVRSEAVAWLHLAIGMRAELDGKTTEALASYRSFAALPMHRRMLIGIMPDPMVERFVSWRIRSLNCSP